MKNLARIVSLVFVMASPALLASQVAPAEHGPALISQECSSEQGAETQAELCGRCGDGYCATSCGENAISCPKDCEPVAQ